MYAHKQNSQEFKEISWGASVILAFIAGYIYKLNMKEYNLNFCKYIMKRSFNPYDTEIQWEQ